MTQFTTDRRTIVKGAAWAVPAVSVAAAAPTLAASPTCEPTYQDITKTFSYTDTLGNIVTAEVTALNVPSSAPAGADLTPISTSSTVTISAASADLLRSLILGNPAEVDGTSSSTSTLSGAYDGAATTALTIERTAVPTSGPIVTVASGTGDASSVPEDASPGVVTITMGSPSSNLVAYGADGEPNGRTFQSTLDKIDGEDYTLATFTVEEC